MAKKDFKSRIQHPTDEQVQGMANARYPFGKCKQCGQAIIQSKVLCNECERLQQIGFGPFDRAPEPHPGQDTQAQQSFPSGRHDGYSDTQPSKKISPGKERV